MQTGRRPKGVKYKEVLVDGTHVRLNATYIKFKNIINGVNAPFETSFRLMYSQGTSQIVSGCKLGHCLRNIVE